MNLPASRLLLCLAVLFFTVSAQARVFVIGVDGASWNAIDPMLAAGELPHLQSLIERGGSANLDTVEPITSPVVWTSIATGRSPEVHGITDFFSTRATIAVPTIYERLAAQGLRVGLYDVLMSWPPPPLPNGFVIPGWLRRDKATWPPEALASLSIFRTDYRTRTENREYFEQALVETQQKAKSWKQLVDRFDPEIGALTYYAVDAMSHRYWHASYPNEFSQPGPRFAEDERNAVQRALRGVDQSIGEITASLDLDGEDSVLIVSDHGFKAVDGGQDVWVTHFEDVLARNDLVPSQTHFKVISTFFAVTIRIAPGPFAERDQLIDGLTSLFASYRTLDGEPLIRTAALDVAERPDDMRRSLYQRARQWAIRKFMSWAFSTKIDPTAHAMVIALPNADVLKPLWPKGEIEVDGRRMPIAQAFHLQRFTGTHNDTAVFIAAGNGIQKQSERGRLSVLDIAPFVAYLADKAIPDDLEGQLPIGWVTRARALASPPQYVAASTLPVLHEFSTNPHTGLEDSGAEDPELIEKLRALGYIE